MDINDNDNDDLFSDFGSDGINPEKYKEQLKKIFKDLTGENLDTSHNDFLNFYETGQFFQDLSDEEQQDIFDEFIESKDMEFTIEFTETPEDIMIEELWTSEDEMITLKRMYYYDHALIATLDPEIQKEIYEKRLEILLEREDFEEAADVRDLLSVINK